MPPLPLTALLETNLPRLSRNGRAIVGALGCFNGKPQSPSQVASLIGLRTRFQLARALRREGLPPLEELAAWTRVLYWLQEAERTDASLFNLAQQAGIDPAIAYRLVHRTTGIRWVQARRAGLAAIVRRLRDQCRTTGTADRGTVPPPWRTLASYTEAGRRALEGRAPVAGPKPPGHPRGELAERLPVSGYPFDVIVTPNEEIWLTRLHAAALDHLGLGPLHCLGSVSTGATPTRIAAVGSAELAYVTNQFAAEVAIIDLRQRRQVGAIPIPGHPLGTVLSHDGQTLYVTTNLDRLYAIRLPGGQVTRSVPIPMACTNLLLHPGGTRLFVPTYKAGTILEVEARTLKPLGRYDVGGVVQEVACTTDGLRLYATNELGWLDAIHLTTGHRESLQFDTMAHGLALSPDGAMVFVGLLHAGAIAVLDRQSLAKVATIATGGRPRRIAFDGSGRRAIIANESGWVDVVH